jgi:hypothetical protein
MFQYYLFIYIIAFLFKITNAVSLTYDSVPSNPGISSTLLNLAPSFGTYIPANYSEVVTMFTMGTLPLPPWQRKNCPHLQPNLVNFTTLFSRYTSGMNVNIPSGSNILLLANALSTNPTFGMIQVFGNLIFDDQILNLTVGEIRVWPSGSLQIGSLTCRMFANINITFTGSAASSSQIFWDPSNKTSKGIMSQGSVDIHGKQYHPTWTRLSRNAQCGKNILFLQDVVNWEVGQLVLITTSAWFDCPAPLQKTYCQNQPHQNEIRMITGIAQTSSGEQAILLNVSLTYCHYAGKEYQIEVALLSRRINLMGQLTNDNFGGHVVTSLGGSGRFSGVRGDRMGQLNILGRYPFHLHLLNDGSTSVIQDCVVTNSYYRAYTVHGTNNSLVTRNIAYGVLGHAYYLESGTEENNVLSYNLAAQVTPIGTPAQGGWCGCANSYIANATFINPSDVSASGFYILDAYNSFVGNVAVGGASGYIFVNAPLPIFLPSPINNGYNNPQNRPLLLFQGNTAHSTGFYWPEQGPGLYVGGQLWVDTNGNLNYNPGRYNRTTMLSSGPTSNPNGLPMSFYDNKFFLVNKGLLHWGGASQTFNLEVVDIGFAGLFVFGQSGLNNALISGYTGNTYNGNYMPGVATGQGRGGVQFYDTLSQLILSNVTFRNFDVHNNGLTDSCIYFLDGSDQYLPQGISASQGINFQNIGSGAYYVRIMNCGASGSPYNGCGYGSGTDGNFPSQSSLIQSIQDFDGTLSGTPGNPQLIGGFGNLWDQGSDCTYNSFQHTRTCNWLTNRGIGYMITGGGAVVRGCQSAIAASCPTYTQQCCYTVGHVSLWGSLASSTTQYISPWGGISGPLNTGWYIRMNVVANPGYSLTPAGFVTGAPRKWSTYNVQIPRGSFIVQASTYPSVATFSVYLQLNGVNYLPLPQASSYSQIITNTEPILLVNEMNCTLVNSTDIDDWCEYTGATGPMWYFDGTYMYIRTVNPAYYLVNHYASTNNEFNFEGASLWSQDTSGWSYYIYVSTCVGCTVTYSYSGMAFYAAPDTPPTQDFPINVGTEPNVTVYSMVSRTLSGSPSITCAAPIASNYPNAVLGSCTSAAAIDTTCTLSCASGHKPSGDMVIYCQSSGSWSSFDSASGCS